MRRNRFFTPDMLDLLLDHRRWHIVSHQIRREVTPVKDPKHQKWMARHSHSHPHTEIMIVLRGYGRMGYCGEIYPFEAGTIFCFGAGETHDLEIPDWSRDTQMLWIVLLGRKFIASITSFQRDLPTGAGTLGHLVMAEDTGLMVANPLSTLAEASARRPDVRTLQLHAAMQTLVAAVIDHGDDTNAYPEEPIQRRVVRMIQEHMEETGGDGLTPAELARMSGYSKSHFMRLFRTVTGKTVQQYLDECRWRHTLELEERGWLQCDIAEHLGFSTPASFSRWKRLQRSGEGRLPLAAWLFPDPEEHERD